MSAEEPQDVARLREAFASVAEPARSRPVDAGRIFDALHGNVSAEERQAVVDELVTNPEAAEVWRLANEMAPAGAAEGSAPTAERAAGGEAWRWMSMAAAAVLVVGAGWLLNPWREANAPVYRGVESRAIASALAPDAVLTRAQPVLRWTGVAGAKYRVRVLTPELEVLEESAESPALEFAPSAETLGRIPAGGRILWQVEGRLTEGGTIVSPTFSARVE
jgi:hypothetical protein